MRPRDQTNGRHERGGRDRGGSADVAADGGPPARTQELHESGHGDDRSYTDEDGREHGNLLHDVERAPGQRAGSGGDLESKCSDSFEKLAPATTYIDQAHRTRRNPARTRSPGEDLSPKRPKSTRPFAHSGTGDGRPGGERQSPVARAVLEQRDELVAVAVTPRLWVPTQQLRGIAPPPHENTTFDPSRETPVSAMRRMSRQRLSKGLGSSPGDPVRPPAILGRERRNEALLLESCDRAVERALDPTSRRRTPGCPSRARDRAWVHQPSS